MFELYKCVQVPRILDYILQMNSKQMCPGMMYFRFSFQMYELYKDPDDMTRK